MSTNNKIIMDIKSQTNQVSGSYVNGGTVSETY